MPQRLELCKKERGEVKPRRKGSFDLAVYLIDYENVNTDGLNGISRLSPEDTVVIFYSENADRMTFGLHRRLNESKASIDIRKVDVGGSNALDFQLSTYLGYLVALNRDQQYHIVSNDRGYAHVANFWSKQKVNVRVISEISSARTDQAAQEAAKSETAAQEKKPAAAPEKKQSATRPEKTPQPENPVPQKKVELPEKSQEKKPDKNEPASQEKEGEKPAEKPEEKQDRRLLSRLRRKPQGKPSEPLTAGVLSELLPVPEEAELVEGFIEKYKTKQGLNNALVRKFGNSRGGELYQKLKPWIADKKGC